MRLVWLGGRCRGGARATDGCLVVGEDVLEANVRVGHAQGRVLGIEDLDELGGCVAHCECMRAFLVYSLSDSISFQRPLCDERRTVTRAVL